VYCIVRDNDYFPVISSDKKEFTLLSDVYGTAKEAVAALKMAFVNDLELNGRLIEQCRDEIKVLSEKIKDYQKTCDEINNRLNKITCKI